MQKHQSLLRALYRLEGRVCRNILKTLICFIVLWGGHGAMLAQGEVIDAGNIGRLESVGRIEFDSFEAEGVIVANGRFALSVAGEHFGLSATNGSIYILNHDGVFIGSYAVQGEDGVNANLAELSFGAESSIASIHTDGKWFFIAQFDYATDSLEILRAEETLLDVWWSGGEVVVETENAVSIVFGGDLRDLSRGFHEDDEAIIRIGRIAPPLAITVTEDGRVKRWHVETGEITAEVQIEGALPIYGQVNAGGDRYLVWRDPMSEALHLLDFETGEDRVVVSLDGVYIPFIFLTAGADVIIGVDVDDEPVVVAWDVATGQQYHLGAYRQCNRPPDMVRLSMDGTTLVIGCDTGLDIWRVADE